MPWSIQRAGSKYEVINSETGRVVGTHPTRAQAVNQQQALYANVPESQKAEQPIENTWQGQFFPRRG